MIKVFCLKINFFVYNNTEKKEKGRCRMTFRIEYAEKALHKLTNHVRHETKGGNFWSVDVHVSNFWHFHIDYELYPTGEVITLTHKKRKLEVCVENGVMTKTSGLRRFDMLFAALHADLTPKLSSGKTFKITHKKLNERYLTNSPYFWAKIEYYLFKKETQEFMYEQFGDEKYRIRAARIQRGIDGYIMDKRGFIEDTKKKALC